MGASPTKFRYIGIGDKFEEEMYENSLLIVCDTPDLKRIDCSDIDKFEKIMDLFTNGNKMVDAELLINDSNQKIYLREWYPAHSGYAWEYSIVNTLDELKAVLEEEVKLQVISKNDINNICDKLEEMGIF